MPSGLLHGRYELLGILKQGGMGAVYRAKDTKLADSACAVKEILEDKQTELYYQERFAQEMAALARLDHPSIPRVRDFFKLNDKAYLVMDLVQGRSLEDELDDFGVNPDPKVVRDMLQVLEVLEYLHSQRPPLLHRDIKPANLLRDRRSSQIKVVDFGLARTISPGQGQTSVGTLGYCAPEQICGRAEPRSDVFSVGATLIHLLRGEPCDPMKLALSDDSAFAGLPEGMAEIVRKATQFDPSERFASAREMAIALDAWLVERGHRHHLSSSRLRLGVEPAPQPSLQPVPQPLPCTPHVDPLRRRSHLPIVAKLSLLLLMAAAALGGLWGRAHKPEVKPTSVIAQKPAATAKKKPAPGKKVAAARIGPPLTRR